MGIVTKLCLAVAASVHLEVLLHVFPIPTNNR